MHFLRLVCAVLFLKVDARYMNVPTDNMISYFSTECAQKAEFNFVMFLVELNSSLASVLYPHLIQSKCRFLEVPIDCEDCFLFLFNKEYELNHKVIIIDYVSFDSSKLTHLVDRIEWMYTLCVPRCNMIVLLSGSDFLLHKHQTMVAESLLSSNLSLNEISLGYYYDNDLSSYNHFMYIRPVVHGCVRHNGIFVPNSKEDWHALTTKPKYCNLNGSVLNVVMNDVSALISLFKSKFVMNNFISFIILR